MLKASNFPLLAQQLIDGSEILLLFLLGGTLHVQNAPDEIPQHPPLPDQTTRNHQLFPWGDS